MLDKEFELIEQEWSYFIASEKINIKPQTIKISPPKEVINALCKRLNLYDIGRLEANIKLQRNNVSKVIHINGKIEAEVTQKCVITVDPVVEKVRTEFDAWFSEPNRAVSFSKAKRERLSPSEQKELPILEEKEDPEEVVDGKIDLGELVVQYLSLALNPYPKKEGACFDAVEKSFEGEEGEGIYDNPFAALKNWKHKESKK